jgi:hypothetical protein
MVAREGVQIGTVQLLPVKAHPLRLKAAHGRELDRVRHLHVRLSLIHAK